jgi:hypothetical protein
LEGIGDQDARPRFTIALVVLVLSLLALPARATPSSATTVAHMRYMLLSNTYIVLIVEIDGRSVQQQPVHRLGTYVASSADRGQGSGCANHIAADAIRLVPK